MLTIRYGGKCESAALVSTKTMYSNLPEYKGRRLGRLGEKEEEESRYFHNGTPFQATISFANLQMCMWSALYILIVTHGCVMASFVSHSRSSLRSSCTVFLFSFFFSLSSALQILLENVLEFAARSRYEVHDDR